MVKFMQFKIDIPKILSIILKFVKMPFFVVELNIFWFSLINSNLGNFYYRISLFYKVIRSMWDNTEYP